MNFCNYNKNIILLYMSMTLWIIDLRREKFAFDNYIVFDYGALEFWIPERWVWYLRGSVEYKLNEYYIGKTYPRFDLKIYWQSGGKW